MIGWGQFISFSKLSRLSPVQLFPRAIFVNEEYFSERAVPEHFCCPATFWTSAFWTSLISFSFSFSLIVKKMTSNSEWKFFFSSKTHKRRLSLETGDNESNCESNFQCYVVMTAPHTWIVPSYDVKWCWNACNNFSLQLEQLPCIFNAG